MSSLLNTIRGASGVPPAAPTPRSTKRQTAPKAQPRVAALPQVQTNDRPLRDVSADALKALVAGNTPPTVFVRSGDPVAVVMDERGAPSIVTLGESGLRAIMTQRADFVRVTYGRGDNPATVTQVAPPLDVVRNLAVMRKWPADVRRALDALGVGTLPALAGIIEAPTIRPDGSILCSPGYDAATGVYYAPADFDAPIVPERPDARAVAQAAELLTEVFCDFPYDGQASRANAVAALATPVLRSLIDGPAPLFLFDKPQAGSGGSLQAEVVALVATGRASAMLTAPKDDEGWRKAITSLLLAGRRVATVDNVDGRLFAPSLSAALTSSVWQDRLLGFSEMVTLPHRVTWLATGNNIMVGGDLPRRCVWVRIDPQQARPWEREGFKHPALLEWVAQHRGAIIGAILVMARAWIVAGRPLPGDLPRLGSFEAWTRTLGGILAHAGIAGFLGNLGEFWDSADEEGAEWQAFLLAWYVRFGEEALTCSQVADALQEDAALREALPGALGDAWAKGKRFSHSLGNALKKRKEMRFPNGLYIAHAAAARGGIAQWRVRVVTGGTGGTVGTVLPRSQPPDFHTDLGGNCATSATSATKDGEQTFTPWPDGPRRASVSRGRVQELLDEGLDRAEAERMAADEAEYAALADDLDGVAL
jgi:hypothetical protein